MALETNSIDMHQQPIGDEAIDGQAAPPAEAPPDDSETAGSPGAPAAEDAAETGRPPSGAPDAAVAPAETLLTEISATVREVADQSRRYHDRAEQREGVIDLLRSELELLRRGERRGLLRPVFADMCRLRGDLLSQAAALPADFDAAKAADLLRSYAETIELTLESNGVVAFIPDGGERFDPRLHRRVGAEATDDPALAGHVSEVRRDGYLDIEANSPIAPAEVTVFAAAKPAQSTEGEQ